jgi:hypothetical protein
MVYHSGRVITNVIGSYVFVEMKETFLLNEFLTLTNVVHLVCKWLVGWMRVVKSDLKVELISSRVMTLG